MRSTVPRMRTVSWADAGKAMQIETKLAAANMRRAISNMSSSLVLR
jgi:hypothetical protein